jgi:outer membrane protein OmpA-like peptidoglycan-associated protein
MNSRRATILVVTALAVGGNACAPKTHAVVVLLPEQDKKTVGAAVVGNKSGAVDLDAARESTRVRGTERPSAVTIMTDAEVQQMFGEALAALPPAPRRFVLNFRFQSDQLTDQARALVPEIIKVVRARAVATVGVTGHTDTMGTPEANYHLGVKRATMVRNLLIAAGLDAARIEVSSLGETDPLVRTADEIAEPRNRRVDITVR